MAVVDSRMVVVEVSGTCYLLWKSLVPGTLYMVCDGTRMYACFPQDDPWYLVSRPFNVTKVRKLGTALNTSRIG